MDFSDILGLGSVAMGLFAGLSKQAIYRQQENSYLQQAELNRQIGEFNAAAVERTGTQNIRAIVEQTKRLMGYQINLLTNRGISLEGSPMFVLGDTKTMGMQRAQEAYFNTQVAKVNSQYAAFSATQRALSMAEEAKYGQYGAVFDTIKGVKDGFTLLNSMMKSSPLNNMSTTVGSIPIPVSSTNSTVGKMLGNFFV